jgi:hypothetical protein
LETAVIAASTIAGAINYCGAVFLAARHYCQRKKSVELEESTFPMITMATSAVAAGYQTPISVPLQSENLLGWRYKLLILF